MVAATERLCKSFSYHAAHLLAACLLVSMDVVFWRAVIAQGHTVVLNWNPQLVPLLKQMSLAKTHQIKAVLHDQYVPIFVLLS